MIAVTGGILIAAVVIALIWAALYFIAYGDWADDSDAKKFGWSILAGLLVVGWLVV